MEQSETSLHDFESDLREGIFHLRAVSDQIFERAHKISRQASTRLGNRTADLLHVAAALELKAECLYTFDQNQRKLALTVGLAVQ